MLTVKHNNRGILPIFILFASLAVFYASSIGGVEATEETAEDWFNDDTDQSVDDVNEGDLNFIAPITDKNILYSEAVMTIAEDSLQTGMVALQQCYRNLDAVAEMEVVYRYKNMKNLQITTSGNIAESKVVDHGIQLRDVGSSAFVCISAEVQILEKTEQFSYALGFGPYYRRFLDGYYPYHVTVKINYPANRINYVDISPASQPLFKIIQQPGKLLVDTWFEGVLLVTISFTEKASDR